MFDFKKWLSKNRILFLFFDFLLFHTFFLFYICASFSKPILPNIVHWPPTRVTLIAGEDTLAANEDHMNCRCFLFVHYFFFFIIDLFKYSHRHPSPCCYVFFFANSAKAALYCHAVAAIIVILWWPRAAKPCVRWYHGPHLLRGDASPLFCHQGAVNAPIIL